VNLQSLNAEKAQLQLAVRLMGETRTAEALPILQAILAKTPRASEARRLLALALQRLGDATGAERELRTGLKLDKGSAPLSLALAELLSRTARRDEAERILRDARIADRRSAPVCVALAELLTASGRALEALQVTGPLVAGAAPDHATLAQHAAALKALGRAEEALAVNERAAALNPDSVVAHHNLAATLGDLAAFARSEASARQAFAKGGDASETWLVYGRALFGQNRLEEAEAAFRQAIVRRPNIADTAIWPS
jgi:tetratricopeptide (TPR) repeat protein